MRRPPQEQENPAARGGLGQMRWAQNCASHAYCSPAGAAAELDTPQQQRARLPPMRHRRRARTVGRSRRRPSTKQRSSAAAVEGRHQKLSEACLIESEM